MTRNVSKILVLSFSSILLFAIIGFLEIQTVNTFDHSFARMEDRLADYRQLIEQTSRLLESLAQRPLLLDGMIPLLEADMGDIDRQRALYKDAIQRVIFLTMALPIVIVMCLTGVTIYLTIQSDRKMNYLAHHDYLTGMPNRQEFLKQAADVLEGLPTEPPKLVAMMLIDAHSIFRYYGTLGPAVGDDLLVLVASRLKQHFPPPYILGRHGGTFFTLLTPPLDSRREAAQIAGSVFKIFGRTFSTAEYDLQVDINIGISVSSLPALDAALLEQNAGRALHFSYSLGHNRAAFFSEKIRLEVLREYSLEQRMRKALDNHEFALYFQPQVDIVTGKLTGFEALIRWVRPDGSVMPPAEFLPLAERNGYVVPIGDWVIREACRQLKSWHDQGHRELRMSVNVSPLQLRGRGFLQSLKGTLAETGVAAKSLTIEITEDAPVDSLEVTIEMLRQIRKLGLRIALDDFGIGYSSLKYLTRLPLDKLKIDKSFVDGLAKSTAGTSIIDEIVALAHKLGLLVVAEGVERRERYEILQEKGVDLVQGYYISRPLPREEVEEAFLNTLA